MTITGMVYSIMEYCSNGSLLKYIQDAPTEEEEMPVSTSFGNSKVTPNLLDGGYTAETMFIGDKSKKRISQM
jgi:hypothetical protein